MIFMKILIVFDDMIVDMLSSKKINPIVAELFIRGRKLNVSLAFIRQSYFAIPQSLRLSSRHSIIMKKIVFNHLSDIDFIGFVNIYKNVL